MKKPNVKKSACMNLSTLEKEISLEKNTQKSKNGKGGITLIALVITVIVLLILARNQRFNVKPEITAS